MESGSLKLLENATHRSLHAHGFSRASSQASLVLTDLFSRYLALLSLTCSNYALHAGRTALSVHDVLGALEELGVGLGELSEYCASEGKELGRYAFSSARRVEDLAEFRAQLSDGLRQDRDDSIPLLYAPFSPPDELSDEEEEDKEEEEEQEMELMDTDLPPVPASPPPRKRARTASWTPLPHIPDFLPPFPTAPSSDAPPPSPSSQSPRPAPPLPVSPPPLLPDDTPKLSSKPLDSKPPLPPPLTSSSASDLLVRVPYAESSLASVPEWHLPSTHAPSPAQHRHSPLPTPQTEPALFAAYHHILTHPPPTALPAPTPARHRVAMALLAQTQKNPRWEPPDTLYASVAPCPPRLSVIGPTYPVPTATDSADLKFPPAVPRPVAGDARLAALISQQASRIPELARHVLPPTILARTSRLTHPPVLQRGARHLVYGPGIPAPWNANALPGDVVVPPTPLTAKTKEFPNGAAKEDPAAKAVLPDARLYATWDYEARDYRVPLATAGRRARGAAAGAAPGTPGGSGVISLGLARKKGVKG